MSTRGSTAGGSRRSARSRSRAAGRDCARPVRPVDGSVRTAARCPASPASRPASSACGGSPIRSSTRRTGTPRSTSSTLARCEPPYLIGMACGFCHVGFNPLNPPENPEAPKWSNLAGAIGNQYWEEGRLFNLRMPPTDFRWHVGNRQPPGTSDTSRFATDHINNPNAINAVFNLAYRPTGRGADGRRDDAPGAPHPQGRRRFDWRRRARRCASTSTSACARTTG